MTTITWLHITDLHIGQRGTPTLWQNVKDQFFKDLQRLSKLLPDGLNLDLILFTGDLAFSGEKQQYDELNRFLIELYQKLNQLGCNPAFLAVPGNHDLTRISTGSDKRWLNGFKAFPDSFTNEMENGHFSGQSTVDNAFINYTDWWKNHRTIFSNFKTSDSATTTKINDGLLPGEFAATFTKCNFQLGILGLNSAFLQLDGAEYVQKLVLSTRQFHHACNGDGPAWIRRHHTSLLLTHHPPDWLNHRSQEILDSEILQPGRFATHLYGHMHVHAQHTWASGGGQPRRRLQGCSLFGLEHYQSHSRDMERSHGYSITRLSFNRPENAKLQIWPRLAKRRSDNSWRIVPNYDAFDLDERNSGTAPQEIELNQIVD